MRRETDGRELVDAVLAFARELNALQREYASRMPRFRREGRMEALLSAYRAEAEALCRRRLTERKRCKALPQRPAFAALEHLALSAAVQAGNCAVVEVLTSEGCLDFRFRLQFREGEWRIDGYQQRYHSAPQVEPCSEGIF